jgi:hypothetical protein
MPPSAPQRRPFRPHFTYLYQLVLTRSRASECLKANHFLTHLALLVGPETLSHPATAQKPLGRGRSPPCAAPCAAARRPGRATPSPKPKRGGLATSPQMRVFLGSPHLRFMCVLGPLFFRSSLYQLVLMRSRCPQLSKANHFLAYSALLAGLEALSRPATAQNSLGRGRSLPPCAPPHAAARRPGWATPSPKPKKSVAFGGR